MRTCLREPCQSSDDEASKPRLVPTPCAASLTLGLGGGAGHVSFLRKKLTPSPPPTVEGVSPGPFPLALQASSGVPSGDSAVKRHTHGVWSWTGVSWKTALGFLASWCKAEGRGGAEFLGTRCVSPVSHCLSFPICNGSPYNTHPTGCCVRQVNTRKGPCPQLALSMCL